MIGRQDSDGLSVPERLFFFGGQAQIIFNLTPGLLGGVIFHQQDGFPLGQAMFYGINPDILQP